MQIEHPYFLIKIYFVNIKQTTQLQLVPEDKVAILRYRSRISARKQSRASLFLLIVVVMWGPFPRAHYARLKTELLAQKTTEKGGLAP